MDVLNKLKSTVSNTVSQLSGVLPGNPVTREYEVSKHIASAGPGLLWKVYSGYKKSTKQEAAIFVLEKKHIDHFGRREKDIVLEILKRGIGQLTRIRHPQILTVQHPLEESRESLAFATEPVFVSLANVLGQLENAPQPLPPALKDFKLFDVEIKYGLQQLGEGLAFLHNDVKMLHCNLCPENIILNHQGAWKIFGFEFCTSYVTSDTKSGWFVKDLEVDFPAVAQPNLNYLAPEIGLNKRTGGHAPVEASTPSSPAADMFSLGVIVVALFQQGELPWLLEGDVERYYRHCSISKPLPSRITEKIPPLLVSTVQQLTHFSPSVRPDVHQFIKIDFFDDVGVKTLNYLDSLFQWDNLQKSRFYKGLPQILPKLPHRVVLFRVLPCLVKEFVNASMVPFVLPCILLIAQEASKDEFVHHILPHLKPVMKIQEPVQILLIFMQKMELLLQKTPAEDVKADVLPMVYRALEAESPAQIQELCLAIIPTFAALIDYPPMKNALLPRIKKLCLNTQQLSVRVNGLLCIGKLLDNLDKWLVLDEVLPLLPKIPSKDPAVLMAILGIYKLVLNQPKLGIPKEALATQIVPFLFPLLVEPGLNVTQFGALAATIKDMFHRVEEEQRLKLQNVQAIQQEQRSALEMTMNSVQETSRTSTTSTYSSNSASSSAQDKDVFARLGLANYGKPNHQTVLDNAMGPKSTPPQILTPFPTPSATEAQEQTKPTSYNYITPSYPSQPKAPPSPQQDPMMASLINSNMSFLALNSNPPAAVARSQPVLMQPNYNLNSFGGPPMMSYTTMTTPSLQPLMLQPRPVVQPPTVKALNRADIDDLLS